MKWLIKMSLLAVALSACSQEGFDERCEREAREYTERFCPKRLENNIILDSIVYAKASRTRTDYHTVSGQIDDSTVLADARDVFRQKAVESIRKSIELKNLKDKGVTFVYKFRSQTTGNELLSVEIPADDYREP